MTLLRRFLAAVAHTGPGYDLPHIPRPGDDVEQWLTDRRDQEEDRYGRLPAWYVIDGLLQDHRRHAAVGTPLDQPLPEPADRHPF